MWNSFIGFSLSAAVLIFSFAAFGVGFAEKALFVLSISNMWQAVASFWLAAVLVTWSYASAKRKEIETELANKLVNEIKNEEEKLTDEERKKISQAILDAMSDKHQGDTLANAIGLATVKRELDQLRSYIATQKKRESQGLPTQSIGLHLVFTGNPGTGKTMVAREIAKLYRSLGLLEKGQLIETDRAGLVAEYVGQTAVKTKRKIEEAIGGVLFIDEAYSLLDEDNGGGFGKEAVDTLLKEMEDRRGSFVVIVAGYKKEMESFVNSNPGLQSRFSRTIHFPDYDPEELLLIFELLAKTGGYNTNDDARRWLASWMVAEAPIGAKGFGNGRFMRNLFDKTLLAQSHRLDTSKNETKEALQEITISDIQCATVGVKQ